MAASWSQELECHHFILKKLRYTSLTVMQASKGLKDEVKRACNMNSHTKTLTFWRRTNMRIFIYVGNFGKECLPKRKIRMPESKTKGNKL